MKIAEAGFLRWLRWAFFSFGGSIGRLPYFGASVLLFLIMIPYSGMAAQMLAVYLMPPAGGGAPTIEYVRAMATTAFMIPFMLPICWARLALDVKRMRGIGLPLILSPIFSALLLASPIFPKSFLEILSLTTFAYLAIMSVVPSKEDRLEPHERKARAWKALATGTGAPKRISGKAIKFWHIVRQGPAK